MSRVRWPHAAGALITALSLAAQAQSQPAPAPAPAPPVCTTPPCPPPPSGWQMPAGGAAPEAPAAAGSPPAPSQGGAAPAPPAYGPGAQPPRYGPGAQSPRYGPGAQQPGYGPSASQPGYGPGQPPAAYGQPPPPGQPPYYGRPPAPGQPPGYPGYYGQPPYPGPPETPNPAEEQEPSPPFFDLAVGTMFPLGLGPEATLEIPGRVLLQLDLTWMPGAYGKAIGGLVGAVSSDDGGVRTLVDESLANSFVVRGSLGWRPFPAHGFEFFLGYTGITVRGDVPSSAIVEVVDDPIVDELEATVPGNLKLKSQLHNIHVVIGWRWLALEDHLIIRANLGYSQTLGSKSSVQVSESEELQNRLSPIVDQQLGAILKSSVKMPLIGLNLGYRF